jgi:hypothetical protein
MVNNMIQGQIHTGVDNFSLPVNYMCFHKQLHFPVKTNTTKSGLYWMDTYHGLLIKGVTYGVEGVILRLKSNFF